MSPAFRRYQRTAVARGVGPGSDEIELLLSKFADVSLLAE
jgi:hypothetical protein